MDLKIDTDKDESRVKTKNLRKIIMFGSLA